MRVRGCLSNSVMLRCVLVSFACLLCAGERPELRDLELTLITPGGTARSVTFQSHGSEDLPDDVVCDLLAACGQQDGELATGSHAMLLRRGSADQVITVGAWEVRIRATRPEARPLATDEPLVARFSDDGEATQSNDMRRLTLAGSVRSSSYEVVFVRLDFESSVEHGERRALFVRGDVDSDGSLTLSDPLALLLSLSADTTTLPCLSAADADGSGDLNFTDAVALIQYLFERGAPPPPPSPSQPSYSVLDCGVSETGTFEILDCETFPPCPPASAGIRTLFEAAQRKRDRGLFQAEVLTASQHSGTTTSTLDERQLEPGIESVQTPGTELNADLPQESATELDAASAVPVRSAPEYSREVTPGKPATLRYADARLAFAEGAVRESLRIGITPLSSEALPLLDAGLVNVTKGPRSGWRFTPHGARFARAISIALPFDADRLPDGYAPDDVYTYYYDEQVETWVQLERTRVDTDSGLIVSSSDHFTDMINAIVVVPDHPTPLSFNPTSIKDIKAADPSAQIQLIRPPEANSQGDCRVGFTIEIPPGRRGLQPEVEIRYSSAAQNGWLGLGWDLRFSQVLVETRWGVPRYDDELETETYLVDGQMLTPVSHRGQLLPRLADEKKTFSLRVEGAFPRIIRWGNQPENYWWELFDKEGTRFTYGANPRTRTLDPNATLRDANGNVFQWGLTETRDTNGNYVRYEYALVEDVGVAGGLVPGTELYPARISYTGYGEAEGAYTVTFLRDRDFGEPRRPDVGIDARGGFKRVTADLLRRIDVAFGSELVRRYELQYSERPFRKTLLQSMVQFGEDGVTEFHRHTFDYFNDIQDADGNYDGFVTKEPSWNSGNDNVSAGLFQFGESSAISGAITDTTGNHTYNGFNPATPMKQGSGGFKTGNQRSRTEAVLKLIDINGDNLPDKVFRSGGGFVFRPNLSGPDGPPSFGSPLPVHNVSQIELERSQTSSSGPELYYGAAVHENEASTLTTSSVYFTDGNGDGLADLVFGTQIFFNHLNAAGEPTFVPDSALTPVPVGPGAVDVGGIVDDFDELRQRNIDDFPLHDTVRRWVAPFTGTVRLNAPVALVAVDPEQCPGDLATPDGVRVAIQLNQSELWSTRIEAGDFAAKIPTGLEALSVRKGDNLYFRVQSIFDGCFDQVAWDPEILYVGVSSAPDANDIDQYRYRASEDFSYAGRRGIFVEVPIDGVVQLRGDFLKNGVTTDDVTVVALKNDAVLFSRTLAWDATGSVSIDQEIPVATRTGGNDRIQLLVRVDSPIDLRQLEWTPELFYVSSPVLGELFDEDGNPIVRLRPPYDIDIYPFSNLTAAQEPWIVPQSGTYLVGTRLAARAGDAAANGDVVFTIKTTGRRLAKGIARVRNGAVENAQLRVELNVGERLFLDLSALNPELEGRLTEIGVLASMEGGGDPPVVVPSAYRSSGLAGAFAVPYRGWAAIGYNGNRERADMPLSEPALNEVQENEPADLEAAEAIGRGRRNYLFYPAPAEGRWKGPDALGWVSDGTSSSSRLGVNFISVPSRDSFAGGRAVSRISQADQTALGGSLLLVSGSASRGDSSGSVDFLDLNGDRFPDVVGGGLVQFSPMIGGLDVTSRPVVGLGAHVRESMNFAALLGINGAPAKFQPDSRGRVEATPRGRPAGNDTGGQMEPLGLSINLGAGDSNVMADLVDMNGDGLLDRVSSTDGRLGVSLNLGYSFAPSEPWGAAAINEGASTNSSLGPTLGFNSGDYAFAGGASLSWSQSQSGENLNLTEIVNGRSVLEPGSTLSDVNGDGLIDALRVEGDRLLVRFNTGAGFAPQVHWRGTLPNWKIGTSRNTGLGGGVYFTIGIGPLCFPPPACYIIINPGFDASQNMARQEAALIDMDGDGFVDHVASESDDRLSVARNQTGRTNLLKEIRRPLGAVITIEYERDGNTFDLPQSRWNLSRVEVFDGFPGDGVDTQVTTFQYAGGRFDRNEREFYGYQTVVEEQRNSSQGNALYRTITREYLNGSFYDRGLLAREVVADAAGNRFTEIVHSYRLFDVDEQVELINRQSTTATAFPQRIRTDRRFYEGEAVPQKSTHQTMAYDAFGNLVETVDFGDPGAEDDWTARIRYFLDDDNYIVGKSDRIVVSDADDNELRRREAVIEAVTGNLLQVRQYLADGQSAVTDMTYFPDGNLRSLTGPSNLHGQRYAIELEYDATVSTHIVRIRDSFGYESAAEHNLKYGKLTLEEDLNGNPTTTVYDQFGRTLSVTGPYQVGSGDTTIAFEYFPDATPPWSLTRHVDVFRNPKDPIQTALFVDGLTRVLQTKKDGTVAPTGDDPADDVMIVSGRITFDFVGRTVRSHYPVTEPLGTEGVFNRVFDAIAPATFEYDVLDRNTLTTLPDATTMATTFGFGRDRNGAIQFESLVVDANANEKRAYRDVRGRMVGLRELNDSGAEVIWTSYRYDPLDQLVNVVDDQENTTGVEYDNFGRTVAIDSVDSGRTEQVYDLASNRIETITANLRAKGQAIRFDYEFNRLRAIRYPAFPENNVDYVYGGPGAAYNRAGRIARVSDESGVEERFYGRLGEIVREVKDIASDTLGGSLNSPEVYATQYVYDTWGRLQELVYPDGEVLTYRYDSGGLLESAVGEKRGIRTRYLEAMAYDKFQQRVRVELGNGVVSRYRYDPLDRRLAGLVSSLRNQEPFQRLVYDFDGVGNILRLENQVPVPRPNKFGGPVVQVFDYDDLYRLTHASGEHRYAPNKVNRYDVRMRYDTIHNIRLKNQQHEVVQPSGQAIPQRKTSYKWLYKYRDVQPHAPAHIGDRTYFYDANGNQTGWKNDRNGTRRTVVWDEENRIQSIADNGHTKTYKYNDTGERVIKRGPQGETVYINPYFTVRNRSVATKHVYAGASRLTSKLSPGKSNIDPDSNRNKGEGGGPGDAQPDRNFVYYYHPDHLGSSSYVTDAYGKLYQHLQYFPSGEGWVDEQSNTQRTPYRFTAKELDEETGLYYFGARSYDPRTSVWQSADLQLDRYLNGISKGGVFNSANLNLYGYAYQNPLKFTDPNGDWVETAWDVFNIGLGVASFIDNVRDGNYGSATLDALGVAGDTVAAVLPIVPGGFSTALKASRAADAGVDAIKNIDRTRDLTNAIDSAADGAKALDKGTDAAKRSAAASKDGVEVVERAMSRAELEATRSTGLVRGGRDGTHFVSDAVNNGGKRARQRLALPQTPEVKVQLEVPKGSFGPPSKVKPANGMPGGGMERTGKGKIPAKVLGVKDL